MNLERSKVTVASHIAQTRLAGSAIEAEAVLGRTLQDLVVHLEAILYGREVASDTTESNPITVEEFDPDGVQSIPATWWDHLKMDLSAWIFRCPGPAWWRYRMENVAIWLCKRVRAVSAPQSHCPRTIIQSIRNRRVTVVCPHIGAQIKIDRHLQFVAFGLGDPCSSFHVASRGGNEKLFEDSQAWREHVFRHALLALCSELDQAFGPNGMTHNHVRAYDMAREIKDLLDRYGVGV